MRDLYLEPESRLPVGLAAAAAAILLLLASVSDVRASDEDMRPTATIAISHGGRAFLAASPQRGALFLMGRVRAFSIAGLGIGGTGGEEPGAKGRVYNLRGVSHFSGAYTELKTGRTHTSGRLWLRNSDGVVLEIEPAPESAALALGSGIVTIALR